MQILFKQKYKEMESRFIDFMNEYETVLDKFKNSSFDTLKNITQCLLDCFNMGGKLILIGNGGSAADCQHISGEMVGRYRKNRIPLPAITLTTDTSVMTCIGNDYDYETVFSRQIEAIGNEHDILWAFSTSGSSPNILKAVKTAKKQNIKIIGFTGICNSELEELSDICLCVNTKRTNHAQEIHQLAYHFICEEVDNEFSD